MVSRTGVAAFCFLVVGAETVVGLVGFSLGGATDSLLGREEAAVTFDGAGTVVVVVVVGEACASVAVATAGERTAGVPG